MIRRIEIYILGLRGYRNKAKAAKIEENWNKQKEIIGTQELENQMTMLTLNVSTEPCRMNVLIDCQEMFVSLIVRSKYI